MLNFVQSQGRRKFYLQRSHIGFLNDSTKPIQKIIAVSVVPKDLRALNPTGYDVMQRSKSIYPRLSWHDRYLNISMIIYKLNLAHTRLIFKWEYDFLCWINGREMSWVFKNITDERSEIRNIKKRFAPLI